MECEGEGAHKMVHVCAKANNPRLGDASKMSWLSITKVDKLGGRVTALAIELASPYSFLKESTLGFVKR